MRILHAEDRTGEAAVPRREQHNHQLLKVEMGDHKLPEFLGTSGASPQMSPPKHVVWLDTPPPNIMVIFAGQPEGSLVAAAHIS